MGLFSSKKHKAQVAAAKGGGAGVQDRLNQWQNLSDADLAYYASRGGADAQAANQIIAGRRGQQADANAYLQAVQRATYQGLSPQFSQGLQQINSNLAGSGPLADSGYGTAMKARLAGQIYGAAQGQIGNQYSSYLGNLLNMNRQYGYQRQLMAYQKQLNRPNTLEQIASGIGGIFGAAGGGGGGGGTGYGG